MAIIMTGATQGIGRAAVQHILSSIPAPDVVIVARQPLAESDELAGRCTTVGADLASLESVSGAARRVAELLRAEPVGGSSALVLNAGVQLLDATTRSVDGFEATFAVNVIANFVLINRLAPLIGTDGRIIITVSDTHFGDLRHNLALIPGPQWRDPVVLAQPGAFPRPHSAWAGRTAYSTSKLAAIHLVHEFARRHPNGPHITAFNPGFVPGTGLARNGRPWERAAMRCLLPILTHTPLASPPHAAGPWLAHLALGPLAHASGDYVDRVRPGASSVESHDPQREARLWQVLTEVTQASVL